MNAIKKLFIASFAILLIGLGSNQMAYATELTYSENIEDTYLSDVISTIETSETDEEANAEVDIKVATDTDIETYAEATKDTDIEIATDVTTDTDINTDIETDIEDAVDTYDSENYEVYEDEQGQVFYIEREPAEIEIRDSDEIVQDDEQVEDAEKKEIKEKKPSYSEKDLRLLSGLIYSEAGNQSYNGMLAVANVVLNRVKSNAYSHADTIKKVIYDKQWAVQFSVTIKSSKTGKSMLDKALEAYDSGKYPGNNPEAEKKAMKKAIKAAKAALNGENNIGDFLCFRMNNKSASSIKKKYSNDYRILGDHIFYRTK